MPKKLISLVASIGRMLPSLRKRVVSTWVDTGPCAVPSTGSPALSGSG
jgi:hypothetical protein